MTNIITHSMDYQMTVHWCNAVRAPGDTVPFPTLVHEHHNVLRYAQKQDHWFAPDYDAEGVLIDNDRLEQFRLACVYDCLSNMLDIAENLDDDATDSQEFYHLLTANDHNDRNEPSWLTTPRQYSIVHRTYKGHTS